MILEDKRLKSAIIISVLLSFLLTAFYAGSGYYLPKYTGPDERATASATQFYLEHKRLAVLPADSDIVPWSSYGGSRVIRPPHNYIAAAIVANINPRLEDIQNFRLASAMHIGLAMGILFLACYLFTRQRLLSLVATSTMAFLPQMIYLASYHNDDVGAILGAAFALLCFVLGYKYRLNRGLLLLFSFTAGFLFINKMTTYAAIPALGLYLIYLMVSQRYRLKGLDILLGVIVFLAAGGWWLINNVIVYGIDDPFLHKLAGDSIAMHASISNPNQNGTYQKYGVGLWGFITNMDYWDATIHNSIANFGQLELSTYKPVYTIFSIPLLSGVISMAYVGGKSILQRDKQLIALLTALTIWLSLSYLMYAYFVSYIDVQFQGKYLIPAGQVFVIMFALGLAGIHQRFKENSRVHFKYLAFVIFTLGSIVVSVVIIMTTIKNYYQPDELRLYFDKPIKIDLNTIKPEDVRNMRLEQTDQGLTIFATSSDPMIFLSADICKRISRNARIEIDFSAETNGLLRIFYDIGNGFKFRNETHQRYEKGRQTVQLDMDFYGKSCRYIRIDPLEKTGKLTIHGIRVTPYLFRIRH